MKGPFPKRIFSINVNLRKCDCDYVLSVITNDGKVALVYNLCNITIICDNIVTVTHTRNSFLFSQIYVFRKSTFCKRTLQMYLKQRKKKQINNQMKKKKCKKLTKLQNAKHNNSFEMVWKILKAVIN